MVADHLSKGLIRKESEFYAVYGCIRFGVIQRNAHLYVISFVGIF